MWSSKLSGFRNKSQCSSITSRRNSRSHRVGPTTCGQRRLHLEALEERTLLSAVAANPFTTPANVVDPPGDSGEAGTRVRVFDLYGGTWADAEKDATSTEDDLLCWAATTSNIFEYTGWGFVGGMTNADQMLDYYEQHWKDVGETVEPAMQWWFSGVNTTGNVDVAGGGFYPDRNYTDYFSVEDNDANILSFVDSHIRAGSPVGLWVLDGFNHEITCWGFNCDPAKTPGATDYYLGVWVTDSDDDKGVANGYTTPNDLHYYDVAWDAGNNRWVMPDYGGGPPDLYINQAATIQPFTAGTYAVNGDQDNPNEDDAFNVSLDATGLYLQVRVNGALVYNPLVSTVHEVNIKGWGGNDTLTVDFTNGDPLAALKLNYDGGEGGDDVLAVVGGGGKIGSYLPASTTGDGVVKVGSSTITFTGLEPVLVSGFNEFTFVTPNSNDVLTIDSPAAGQNRISGTSGGVAFESLVFSSVTNFEIDTATNDGPLADPNDTVTFSSDLVATGLQTFTVDLGIGNDVANAAAVVSHGVTLLGGAGDDTLTAAMGGGRLEGGDGNDTLNVNGSLTGALVVRGGDPSASDVLNYTAASGAATRVDLGTSTITQASPTGGPVVYSSVERVNLISSGASSLLRVVGTAGEDQIDFTPTALGTGSFNAIATGAAVLTSPQFTYTGVGNGIIVDGGTGGFDQLGLTATSGNDAINAVQPDATHLNFTLNAFTQPFTLASIEAARIESGAGDELDPRQRGGCAGVGSGGQPDVPRRWRWRQRQRSAAGQRRWHRRPDASSAKGPTNAAVR